MALLPGHKLNFETLQQAMLARDAALLDCRRIGSGEQVAAICAVNRQADGSIEFVPLAKLFDGNPYEEILPPGDT